MQNESPHDNIVARANRHPHRIAILPADPTLHLCLLHKSRTYAQAEVDAGRAEWIEPEKKVIRLKPSPEDQTDRRKKTEHGTMRDAWHVDVSDCYFVMQMATDQH